MKGKKISDYNPLSLSGLLMSINRMTNGEKFRDVAITTKNSDFTVDTVFAPDTYIWETGISANTFNDGDWIIVDEYKTKKEAKIGHQKWVKYMETNPKKLIDIHINETFKKESK